MVMPGAYDIIIVGAGHNGLVTAAYLARAGLRVLVLERRDVVGGACVTEELWPGFKVSTAPSGNGRLRPEIIRDLELARHGFELLPRSPSSFTPFPDGRFLLMGPDKELTRHEVSKFSRRDADALPRYEAMLERVADFIEPTLLQTPPDPWSLRPRNLLHLAGLGWRFLKLGREGPRAPEVLTGAARPRRRHPGEQPRRPNSHPRRPGDGRGARRRHRAQGAPRRLERRRPRHLPQAGGGGRPAARFRERRAGHRLLERVAEDQRGAVRAAGLQRREGQRPATGRAPARHDSHRPDARLHGAGVRRCQVRPPLGEPDPRVHHPLGPRHHGGAPREARDVVFRA